MRLVGSLLIFLELELRRPFKRRREAGRRDGGRKGGREAGERRREGAMERVREGRGEEEKKEGQGLLYRVVVCYTESSS